MDVEEGYFTFDTLPYGLKARAGKFYSAFGKANQFHTHAMPWVDKPLMIRNFFGEEGMSEPGGELSWLVPNPWDKYIELIFQVQDNRNDLSFADGRVQRPDVRGTPEELLRSQQRFQPGSRRQCRHRSPTPATAEDHWTNLEGVDVTYKWRPAQQGLYRSLTWMNELLLSQKEQEAEDTVDSYGAVQLAGVPVQQAMERLWAIRLFPIPGRQRLA